ncbi:MAG: hypothetical protein KIH89_001670 [Candidatus Shapirobacteria bacterium]|nr:hypothetical protein [Candidatus Shapirobacteria bacterium]
MTKNPLINAICATLYITLIGLFMFYGTQLFPQKDTILTPIAMISLFTLSAAIMGYIFLSQPLILFLDGHQKTAVKLFLQTIAAFAIITLIVFLLIFLGIVK